MLRSRTILQRIVFLHILAIGATCLVMPVAAFLALRSTAEAQLNEALRQHADAIAHHLALTPDGDLRLDLPGWLRVFYKRSYSGFAYAVVDEGGRTLFSSLSDGGPIFADGARDRTFHLEALHKTSSYSGISVSQRIGAQTVWIQVAQDLQHPDVIIDNVVAAFLYRVAWISGTVLLVLLAVDIGIIRDALHPLREASRNAQAIEPARLDLRLPVRDIPRDVLPLVKAINQALDRLEAGFRMQREFTADAAHELRTPLSVLRARVDLLADDGARRALQADIERMGRVVGQIIEIAELETFVADRRETADLQAVAAEVVGFLAPLALAEGKVVALTGETAPILVMGAHERLFQALRNLVENAIRHTPKGGTVETAVSADGSAQVLDEGPGVDEADRELIFRRFWRRDRRRSGSAGLGLSIVARIMETHEGRIEVGDRPGGGAAFTLRFRLAGEPGSGGET
jgi:signal transduction histidine kinase